MWFIYIQQPDLSSQNVCSPSLFNLPASNQLHIIGLNLEIKCLFHLLMFLNFPFQSMAWDRFQQFQEAQSYSEH